ncbi:SDR family NAD(P)-dependent oxidoreductase [Labedaea rhizosphaerae]|uniref:NAD(P)-dependent dehydrogenase (Short-subunit alcohol dehydrogenase family) n=1 Tax=Labedaea rhizosphaerae TaxID=598644 RepID=A0A4R6S850_LABRH|nr:SDR family NAD(P)-dependent oxidoreductase [Labedaea rhizosphaerae]TDP95005.1 NAD(P)-dependent dehydrogenase (short-subunit alcohol dehydrogenase family) [Labedaea rhizosphaerae]
MRLASTLDTLADRSVVIGYSKLGYLLRRRWFRQGDPAPDALAGKVVLVTGASSGLGTATAAGVAALGATTVLVVRSVERGERTRAELAQRLPEADFAVARCDLDDLDDVRRFAADALDRWPTVDVVVHNAGTMPPERTASPQGHELALATHVLGPLLLTEQLRPALARATDPRVILMSSGGMYAQPVPGDVEYRTGRYKGAVAYARTKRLQVAFTPLLAERYASDGIAVHALHPGWADTPGVAGSLPGFHRITGPLLRTAAEGADTAIWLAATTPPPPTGRFWHDRRQRPTHYLPWGGDDPQAVRRGWAACWTAVGRPV